MTLKPRILLTGAAGLLGSHLTDILLHRGYQVTGIDNLSLGTMENLSDAMKHPAFQFEKMDVVDPQAFEDLPHHDIIIHMAAYKIEVPGLKGVDILRINSHGTANMLDLARRWKSRFIFASTSDVYGRNPNLPFSEDADIVLGPSVVSRWGYAASKVFDEHLCFAHQREYHLPVVVLRYFNTYGPRHELTPRSGGPQALFLDAILRHKPMIIHGDGLQKRCFAYVSDSMEMTARLVDCPEANGEIINIGNPNGEITIRDLATTAYEVAGGDGEPAIEFVSHAKAFQSKNFQEVNRRIPEIAKAVRMTGFVPGIGNREGLQLTYEWQRNLDCYSNQLR